MQISSEVPNECLLQDNPQLQVLEPAEEYQVKEELGDRRSLQSAMKHSGTDSTTQDCECGRVGTDTILAYRGSSGSTPSWSCTSHSTQLSHHSSHYDRLNAYVQGFRNGYRHGSQHRHRSRHGSRLRSTERGIPRPCPLAIFI